MNIHEYQAKRLLTQYGIPVPKGIVCYSLDDIKQTIGQLGFAPWIIKCQIHAGGRGKADGVKIIHSQQEAINFAHQWLGNTMTTNQTTPKGQPIHCLLIETVSLIKKELYLSVILDRNIQRTIFIVSSEGGMDIEKIADDTPNLIHKIVLDPLTGAQAFQGRQLAYQLGLKDQQIQQFTDIFLKLAKLFLDNDLTLLEINPLVITDNDQLCCLDAKISIDNNALYRQSALQCMYDATQEDDKEALAAQSGFSYVPLDGNIGCLVNGAGLAMATMDLIKLHGGSPANFLDIGGNTTKDRVIDAFKIILLDKNIDAILVNIFGGIVRCDLIAEGILAAIIEANISIPIIVRLEGNNAQRGVEILSSARLNIIAENTLTTAVKRVITLAQEGVTQ